MMNEPLPFKGLNMLMPIIIPTKGKGFINQGSGLLVSEELHSQQQGPSKYVPEYTARCLGLRA